MLPLYRTLLYLYPTGFRCEFGEEVLEVLSEVQGEIRKKSAMARIFFAVREAGGLLRGGLHERLRSITGSHDSGIFSLGRFAMKSEFRFPKAAVGLMVVILAAVMFTIEKAKAISASVPHANPSVGHIQPAQMTILPSLLVAMFGAIVVGLIGWGILFALHRSGVQQLSVMNPSTGVRANK
ncbi:MAG: hypothetical protein DMG38_20835 [Acidobacteria bacterium]|nr:MAG: hypothetical protein DMG38_20835 [Acidobacteriota bacterium]